MQIDKEKTAFNARVKREMDLVLRAKSWEEKVASIKRMNAADQSAKRAMREALAGSDCSARQPQRRPKQIPIGNDNKGLREQANAKAETEILAAPE